MDARCGVTVVTAVGGGRARGLAHGSALAAGIASAAAALRAHLGGAASAAVAGVLEPSGTLCRAAARLAPDLWAEVLGIAEGAGAPLGDVLMLTFLDEVWGLTGAASDGGRHPGAAAAAAAAGPVGCTTLAGALPSRAGGAGTVAGQTMDLPRWTEGRLAVLRVSGGAGERASLVMTYPGCLGLCGARSGGLIVAVNALPQLGFDGGGLGVAFIVRSLLAMDDAGEAGAFLQRVPHAAGQAYTVADTAGVVEVWECGPGCAVRLAAPAGGRAWATHTNHVLGPSERARGAAAGESVGRLATVDAALARGEAPEAALGAAVKRGGGGADAAAGVTFAAFVARAPGARVAFCDGARMRAARPESPLPLDAWDTVTFEGP